MMVTPQLSHLGFEIPLLGGLGYALGKLMQVNEKYAAAVLATASLANYILFVSVNHLVPQRLKLSENAVYTGTNLMVHAMTILFARHLELISKRMAGGFLFVSTVVFAARLNMINTKASSKNVS